ncbi:MAG: tautomerase family protein [Marinobacter sp.]|nr:tautomerase family protein [Marinobacter sp.]
MLEGRTTEQKEALIQEVSEALVRSPDAPIERGGRSSMRYPNSIFGIGGRSAGWSSTPSRSNAGTHQGRRRSNLTPRASRKYAYPRLPSRRAVSGSG